ncbi:MAG: hypothetical protein IE909_17040, partial [Campylobacterales bacterium]|nr:hypothetical protein [Campylobacterales bacterium]
VVEEEHFENEDEELLEAYIDKEIKEKEKQESPSKLSAEQKQEIVTKEEKKPQIVSPMPINQIYGSIGFDDDDDDDFLNDYEYVSKAKYTAEDTNSEPDK